MADFIPDYKRITVAGKEYTEETLAASNLKSSLKRKGRKKLKQQERANNKGNWPVPEGKGLDENGNLVEDDSEVNTLEKTEGTAPENQTKLAEKPPVETTVPKGNFPVDPRTTVGVQGKQRPALWSPNPETRELMSKGIMKPLVATGHGIIFPYTPTIMWNYSASYGTYDMVHGQYQQQYYQNTPSPTLQLTATLTAQTSDEALYMLASLHFLKWATKGDFGAFDQSGEERNATAGSPPPILRFRAYGHAGADNLPVVIRSVNYTYPEDVDYVNIGPGEKKGRMINGIYYSYNEIQEMNYEATEYNEGEYGAVRYPEYAEEGTVPTQILVSLDMAIQLPPARVRDQFNIKEYALGRTLTKKGFI